MFFLQKYSKLRNVQNLKSKNSHTTHTLLPTMRTVDFIPSHCPQKKARTTPGVVLAMCVAYESRQLFLAVYFVRNRELLTAFGTTRSQNATTVSSRHALTETMLVVSLAIVGLERSFHCCIYRYYYVALEKMLTHLTIRSANLITNLHPAKKTGEKCHYLEERAFFSALSSQKMR